MANVLYYGKDTRIVTMLEDFFKRLKETASEMHAVTPVEDEKKLNESLAGVNFEVILVEQSILPKAPQEWLKTFKRTYPNNKSYLIMVGDEHDHTKLFHWLEAGWTDYIVNPPDKPLILEKIYLYAKGERNKDRQVYSLKMGQHADLARPGIIEELSEFDCRIRSGVSIPANDLVILYSIAFSEDHSDVSNVVVRCYKTEKHPSQEGFFLNYFYFIGVTPDILTHIRTTLRKAYVQGKSKE